MFRRSVRSALVLAATALATTLPGAAHAALPPTSLHGQFGPAIPLVNAAMITKETTGYRYRAGQQDSHLTITVVDGGLLYVDTGTKELRSIPKSCQRRTVDKGIAAWCRIPARFNDNNPMFLEVWPRLGDDFVDASTLSHMFRLWALVDAGNDTVYGGAGDDFVNGAQDDDKVYGGGGNDWLRTGIGRDQVFGDDGNDKLVGAEDADEVHGGAGNDKVYGGSGADQLWTDDGNDVASCGTGADSAFVKAADRTSACEVVNRS